VQQTAAQDRAAQAQDGSSIFFATAQHDYASIDVTTLSSTAASLMTPKAADAIGKKARKEPSASRGKREKGKSKNKVSYDIVRYLL
jgi:hypothetical protein